MSEEENFTQYHQALESTLEQHLPCIPFLGVFLSKVVQLDAYNAERRNQMKEKDSSTKVLAKVPVSVSKSIALPVAPSPKSSDKHRLSRSHSTKKVEAPPTTHLAKTPHPERLVRSFSLGTLPGLSQDSEKAASPSFEVKSSQASPTVASSNQRRISRSGLKFVNAPRLLKQYRRPVSTVDELESPASDRASADLTDPSHVLVTRTLSDQSSQRPAIICKGPTPLGERVLLKAGNSSSLSSASSMCQLDSESDLRIPMVSELTESSLCQPSVEPLRDDICASRDSPSPNTPPLLENEVSFTSSSCKVVASTSTAGDESFAQGSIDYGVEEEAYFGTVMEQNLAHMLFTSDSEDDESLDEDPMVAVSTEERTRLNSDGLYCVISRPEYPVSEVSEEDDLSDTPPAPPKSRSDLLNSATDERLSQTVSLPKGVQKTSSFMETHDYQSTVQSDLWRFQLASFYSLTSRPEIRSYIQGMSQLSENDAYKISMEREPQQKK